MTGRRTDHRGRRQDGGFALLFLLIVIGASASFVVMAVNVTKGPRAELRISVDDNLAQTRWAVAEAYLRNGVFPANLDGLATAAGLPVDGKWRTDPYGTLQDLRYRRNGRPSVVTVQSRGPDGRLNTADDPRFSLSEQEPGRARSRNVLRLIRARLLQSGYRTAVTMTPTDLANLRQWSRDYARARRAYQYADAATRAALDAQMLSLRTSVQSLCAAHGCPPVPNRVTGGSGLMRGLGLPDSKAVDGFGRTLIPDPVVGVVSRGGDNRRGTSDDF